MYPGPFGPGDPLRDKRPASEDSSRANGGPARLPVPGRLPALSESQEKAKGKLTRSALRRPFLQHASECDLLLAANPQAALLVLLCLSWCDSLCLD
jgi:hypothetical protein